RPEARALNSAFRGKDYPTNVLTFPLSPEVADIAICPAVVRLEALKQKKTLADHHAHMVVHGVLHAAGFDHQSEAEAEAMEAIEVAALARLGVKNPYE
ncbi:MAG: rRNA maturation RNase YbeY, partial [Casimicrobiaceae bacterium]